MILTFISFFFNDTATTEIYTLSLHDALPILRWHQPDRRRFSPIWSSRSAPQLWVRYRCMEGALGGVPHHSREVRDVKGSRRSEEHTSELQSRQYLVCRLLLEKKKKIIISNTI